MKSKITLVGFQIKSVKKFRKLAKSLDTIEKECGIKNVKIDFKNCFICGDIDFTRLEIKTPMEQLLANIFWESEK